MKGEMTRPPRPAYDASNDCGRQRHSWRVAIEPGEIAYCARCGKARRKTRRRK